MGKPSMLAMLIVIGILALILLARFGGVGRDWWPRGPSDPFSR